MPTWWNHLRWDRDLHIGAREIGGFTVNRRGGRLYRAVLWVLLLGRTRYTP